MTTRRRWDAGGRKVIRRTKVPPPHRVEREEEKSKTQSGREKNGSGDPPLHSLGEKRGRGRQDTKPKRKDKAKRKERV
jgi:hypothetical protein